MLRPGALNPIVASTLQDLVQVVELVNLVFIDVLAEFSQFLTSLPTK